MQEELAKKLRDTVQEHNALVSKIESILRDCKSSNMEIELLDGLNTEVAYDLDGLTGFRLRIVNILAKMPL